MERRTFLHGAAVGLVGAALPFARVSRLARAAGGQLLELTARPANYESLRSTFTTRITPLDRFYLRNHFDLPVGDPASFELWSAWGRSYRLNLRGLLARPLSLSLAELAAMKQTTVEAVLQCAGNGRGLFRPRVPGVQWRWGAMGNAEWTGVRLRDVLALAGPSPEARHLQLAGAEKPTLEKTPPFVRGIPIDKALHPDTLLALRMNGQLLSPQHGFPVRLVVPGWVGDDWVKWISDIELRADEAKGFFYETGYRFPDRPGAPGQPVPPEQMKPMTRLVVKSLIGSISDGAVLPFGAGAAHELIGVAFSGEARIQSVDVSVDGGASWQPATLDPHDSAYGFRLFRHRFQPKAPGSYRIASRATDSRGAVQPAEPVWNPSGYLFNAIEYTPVEVRA